MEPARVAASTAVAPGRAARPTIASSRPSGRGYATMLQPVPSQPASCGKPAVLPALVEAIHTCPAPSWARATGRAAFRGLVTRVQVLPFQRRATGTEAESTPVAHASVLDRAVTAVSLKPSAFADFQTEPSQCSSRLLPTAHTSSCDPAATAVTSPFAELQVLVHPCPSHRRRLTWSVTHPSASDRPR